MLRLEDWQLDEIVTFLTMGKIAISAIDVIKRAIFKATSMREHTFYTIGKMVAHLEKYVSQSP
jgi:hypothetical protein